MLQGGLQLSGQDGVLIFHLQNRKSHLLRAWGQDTAGSWVTSYPVPDTAGGALKANGVEKERENSRYTWHFLSTFLSEGKEAREEGLFAQILL